MMRSVLFGWTELVTLLALVTYIGTMIHCGRLRARHGIKAPATTGHPAFERAFRIQQNTMEQLVVFLPALWLFSSMVNPLIGAALGALWVVGRVIYAIGYARDPDKRGLGFGIAGFALIVLLVGALVQALINLPILLRA
jgi:uncharacterized membrane protein YecN with MAPEG domain